MPNLDPDGNPVKAIAAQSFKNLEAFSADVSQMTNLEVIGKQAFFRTPIDEFEFSYLTNLQTIEKEAFEDTALTKADFKDLYHLQEIGESAFLHSNISYLRFDNNELMRVLETKFSRNPLKELHFGNLPNITLIGKLHSVLEINMPLRMDRLYYVHQSIYQVCLS